MLKQPHTSVIKALRDASEPLSTATLANTMGADEMTLHVTLRRLLRAGRVERRIEAGEARWSCPPPPKVKEIKPRRLTHRGNHAYKRICPTYNRPLEGRK
jgi:hypothetical protein